MSERVALVVPARDEAQLLPRVLAAVPEWMWRVILVDDGSRDATARVIREWDDGRGVALRHPSPRGVGAAIQAGYRRALSLGADIAVVVGGDAQMDLSEIGALLEPLREHRADYVQGNRFAREAWPRTMPGHRRWGNLLLSALTSWACASPVGDSQCGFTAATAGFLRRLSARSLPDGYGFPAFVRWEAHRMGARVVEVPVRAIYADEVSGIHPLRDPLWIGARLLWRGVRSRGQTAAGAARYAVRASENGSR